MSEDDLEVIHGSGNVFRDLGLPNPEFEQLRAILSAWIIKVLDARKLTVRKAQELTGVAAADFSRIRRVKLERFTIGRLLDILDKLDQDVKISVDVQPRSHLAADNHASPLQAV
jgi:predicted XRE-type DNA-binding protein